MIYRHRVMLPVMPDTALLPGCEQQKDQPLRLERLRGVLGNGSCNPVGRDKERIVLVSEH
jgi:hypothetical protein